MEPLHHAERGPLFERRRTLLDHSPEARREPEDIETVEAESHAADGPGFQQELESKTAAPADVVDITHTLARDLQDQCDGQSREVEPADTQPGARRDKSGQIR